MAACLPHRPLRGAGDIRKPKSILVSPSLDRWPGFGSGTRLFVFKTQRLAVIARFLRPACRAAACRYGAPTALCCAHDRLLLGQRATPSICLAGERSSCAAAPLRTFPAGMHTHVPRAAASEARLYLYAARGRIPPLKIFLSCFVGLRYSFICLLFPSSSDCDGRLNDQATHRIDASAPSCLASHRIRSDCWWCRPLGLDLALALILTAFQSLNIRPQALHDNGPPSSLRHTSRL